MNTEHTWSVEFSRGLLEGAGYRTRIVPASPPFFSKLHIASATKTWDAKIERDRIRSSDIRELLDNPQTIGQMRVKDAEEAFTPHHARVNIIRPRFGPKAHKEKRPPWEEFNG
jgi:hypothetical protein